MFSIFKCKKSNLGCAINTYGSGNLFEVHEYKIELGNIDRTTDDSCVKANRKHIQPYCQGSM